MTDQKQPNDPERRRKLAELEALAKRKDEESEQSLAESAAEALADFAAAIEARIEEYVDAEMLSLIHI